MLENVNLETIEFAELDDKFIKQFGTGEKTELIDGFQIHKSVTRYTSNSRKSSDWHVTYIITNPAGQTRKLEKNSIYSNNRSNDPDRNWGLHE